MKFSRFLIIIVLFISSLSFLACSDDESTPTGLINPSAVSDHLNDFTTMFGSVAGN